MADLEPLAIRAALQQCLEQTEAVRTAILSLVDDPNTLTRADDRLTAINRLMDAQRASFDAYDRALEAAGLPVPFRYRTSPRD